MTRKPEMRSNKGSMSQGIMTESERKAAARAVEILKELRRGKPSSQILEEQEGRKIKTPELDQQIETHLNFLVAAEELQKSTSVKSVNFMKGDGPFGAQLRVLLKSDDTVFVRLVYNKKNMAEFLKFFNERLNIDQSQTVFELNKKRLIVINIRDEHYTISENFERILKHLLPSK